MGLTMVRLIATALTVLMLATGTVAADTPKVLSWASLVPKGEPLRHPFREISSDIRYDLEYLASIRYWKRTGQINEGDEEFGHSKTLTATLAKKKIDIEPLLKSFDDFVAEVEKRNKEVVPELDGQMVRIPGYALPLEMDGTSLKEFLLVPNVGACIHTPAPPANQMVFVKLEKTYQPTEIYQPVWITGRMRLQKTNHDVNYSDGHTAAETAYTLEGVTIEPYQQERR